MKRLLPLATSLLLISCSTYYGNLTGNTFTNQKIETTAIGTSSAKYVLGIGGNNKNALVLEAKKNLYKNFPLKPNQNYSNFAVDFKNSFYFLFASQKVVVSADIVSINNLENETKEQNLNSNQFYPNDSVIVNISGKYEKGKVIDVNDLKASILIDSNLKIKSLNQKEIFLLNNRFNKNLTINETTVFTTKDALGIQQTVNGKIIGIGFKKVLVETTTVDGTKLVEVIIE